MCLRRGGCTATTIRMPLEGLICSWVRYVLDCRLRWLASGIESWGTGLSVGMYLSVYMAGANGFQPCQCFIRPSISAFGASDQFLHGCWSNLDMDSSEACNRWH